MLLHSGLKLHPPLSDTIYESAMTLSMTCLTLYHHFLLLLAELSFLYLSFIVVPMCASICNHSARLFFYLRCSYVLSKHLPNLCQALFM